MDKEKIIRLLQQCIDDLRGQGFRSETKTELILRTIRGRYFISRSELARKANLSARDFDVVIQHLMEQGHITSFMDRKYGAGRPTVYYQPLTQS
jgi:predicted transcriptional regulator